MTDAPISFTRFLLDDVATAISTLQESDTGPNRRGLIRTVFAAIEGLHWQLKDDVLRHAQIVTRMTIQERAAMLEESYSVDDRGAVNTVHRFLPLTTTIRLVVSIVQRYRTEYEVDYSHPGWADLKAAILVRNRLVHPKSVQEMNVSDEEIEQGLSALDWFSALVTEVLREAVLHHADDETRRFEESRRADFELKWRRQISERKKQ
jgi:hypothetical protein